MEQENKRCEKCESEKIEESVKDFSSDNVMKIFKCQECGHEKSELVHIG